MYFPLDRIKRIKFDWRSFFLHNWKQKLLALFLALVLWFYVAARDDRVITRQFLDVPLQVVGETEMNENGFVLAEAPPDTVTLRVRGQNSLMRNIIGDNLVARIDLSKVQGTGEQLITPTFSGISSSLDVQVTHNILITVDHLDTKTVPLEISLEGDLPQGYLIGNALLRDATQCVLKGPRNILDTIVKGVCAVDVAGRTESFQAAYPITFMDKDGAEVAHEYVSADIRSVTAQVNVWNTRTFTVDISQGVEGSPGPGWLLDRITCSPQQVTLWGERSVLDSMEGDTVGIVPVSIAGITQNTGLTAKLDVPEGVYLLFHTEDVPEVLLTAELSELLTDEITLTVNTTNLASNLRVASISDTGVLATVTGTRESIDSLTAEQKSAWVNLSSITKAGTYRIAVEYTCPDPLQSASLVTKLVTVVIE